MYLNLGCGGHLAPRPAWVNVDAHRVCDHEGCAEFNPDVVADVRELPFDDGCADAIYGAHILEHLPLDDVVPALREWKRVLKPAGRVAVVGPDYDRALRAWPEMCETIWPGQPEVYPGAGHAWCATANKSLELMREVFPGAEEVPIAELDPFWPAVTFLGWQFAITA